LLKKRPPQGSLEKGGDTEKKKARKSGGFAPNGRQREEEKNVGKVMKKKRLSTGRRKEPVESSEKIYAQNAVKACRSAKGRKTAEPNPRREPSPTAILEKNASGGAGGAEMFRGKNRPRDLGTRKVLRKKGSLPWRNCVIKTQRRN